MTDIHGRDAVKALAEHFPQLCLPVGTERSVYLQTINGAYTAASLDHFRGSDGDSLVTEHTPAGDVLILTLADRADFETALSILAYRCERQDIPNSQGASMINGVRDRMKLTAEKARYLGEHPDADPMGLIRYLRNLERERLNSAVILLSTGAYSGITPDGYDEAEWLRISHTIRRFHECTHFICSRKYGHMKGVFDELEADTVGIYAALGRTDIPLLERFLGIENGVYTGGRLEIYADISDSLLQYVHDTLIRFDELIHGGMEPYELIPLMERYYE